MDIIEQIGSYAGLAAIVGLAVMSALYFSQARDVKRLREWAGRAPERSEGGAAVTQPPRVVAKPVPKPPGVQSQPAPVPSAAAEPAPGTGAPAAQPAAPAQTVAAQAAATGAAPAVAHGPAAATPAAARAAGGTGVEEPAAPATESPNGTEERAVVSEDTVVHPAPAPPGGPDEDVGEAGPGDRTDEESGDRAEEEAAERSEEGAAGDGAGAAPEEPEGAAALQESGDEELDEVGEEEDEDRAPDEEELDDGSEAAAEPGGLPAPEAYHEEIEDTGERPAAAPPVPPQRPTIPIGAAARPEADEPRSPILPPYSQSRPGGGPMEPPREGLFSSRRRALLVLGGTVLGIAVLAFGVQQLTGEDDGGTQTGSSNGGAEQPADEQPARKRPAAVDPSKVTVAVLNGTTVPGLARQIGDTIEQQGFQLGTVTNFIDQQRAESVVLYAPGAEREAADVGRRLKIAQRESIDAESQGQAGDATVVVVAGADKTQ